MKDVNFWFLLVGGLLIFMVLAENFFKTKAISTAIVYLAIGYGLGPSGASVFNFHPVLDSKMIEVVAEIVILASLFSAGLKMSIPFRHSHWRLSVKLATVTMALTVLLISVYAHYLMAMPWAFGILLGGILAPTDPVLASAVQIQGEDDQDRLRTGLTGEAGLNDGTAFPVVMLGLTLLSLNPQSTFISSALGSWLGVDLLWATVVGLGLGYGIGWLGTKVIIMVHPNNKDELVIEDFVSIGLVALSYALAIYAKAYGFLAVFACGLAFSRVERAHFDARDKKDDNAFAPALIKFTTQLERIGEVATVVLLGALISYAQFKFWIIGFALVFIFLLRPLAVHLTTAGNRMNFKQRTLMSWFGIRGIGSIYYLMYTLNHGVKGEEAQMLVSVVLVTIVISIFVHGISANPFMKFYNQKK